MIVRTAKVTLAPVGPYDTATEATISHGGQTDTVEISTLLPALGSQQYDELKLKRAIKILAKRYGTADGSPANIDTQFFRAAVNDVNVGEQIDTMLGKLYIGNVVESNGVYAVPYGPATNQMGTSPLMVERSYVLDESTESPIEAAKAGIMEFLYARWRFNPVATGSSILIGQATKLYPLICNLVNGNEWYYFGTD